MSEELRTLQVATTDENALNHDWQPAQPPIRGFFPFMSMCDIERAASKTSIVVRPHLSSPQGTGGGEGGTLNPAYGDYVNTLTRKFQYGVKNPSNVRKTKLYQSLKMSEEFFEDSDQKVVAELAKSFLLPAAEFDMGFTITSAMALGSADFGHPVVNMADPAAPALSDFVNMMAEVDARYQPTSVWIMNAAQFWTKLGSIVDFSTPLPPNAAATLLGKPVYLSHNFKSAFGQGVLYGDPFVGIKGGLWPVETRYSHEDIANGNIVATFTQYLSYDMSHDTGALVGSFYYN